MFSMPHTTETEPTAAELAAIEAEAPRIEAELALLDAEITFLTATRPSALDWRRLRRMQARVIRAYVETTQHPTTTSTANPSGVAA